MEREKQKIEPGQEKSKLLNCFELNCIFHHLEVRNIEHFFGIGIGIGIGIEERQR
jgi:hypothetical protein